MATALKAHGYAQGDFSHIPVKNLRIIIAYPNFQASSWIMTIVEYKLPVLAMT
jgi:hypothetical protein